MELKLEQVEQRVGAEVHLYPLDIALVPLAVTVLRPFCDVNTSR